MNQNFKRIGWIGTGVMGKSMCKYLIKSGYNLSVYNRTKSKTQELQAMGAKLVEPHQIAETCDAVFLMLGYPKDVEETVLGPEGLLRRMKPNSILIDHTTSSPDLAERIYKESKEFGVHSYDAPVSGGDIGAKAGKLIVMVGGDEDKFSQVKSLTSSYSISCSLMGVAGKGQHTKLANQIIIASSMIGLVEGIVYGARAGLNLESLIELLKQGAAASFNMNSLAPRILKRDFEPGFYVEHFLKDLDIALKECQRLNLKLKGLELAHSFYKMMTDEGLGRKGTQGLVMVLEKMNNMKIN